MTVDGNELETVARKSGELKGPKSRSARRFDDGLSIVGDKICFPVARAKEEEEEWERKDSKFWLLGPFTSLREQLVVQFNAGQISDRFEMPPIILAFQGAHFNGYSTTAYIEVSVFGLREICSGIFPFKLNQPIADLYAYWCTNVLLSTTSVLIIYPPRQNPSTSICYSSVFRGRYIWYIGIWSRLKSW